MSQGQIQNEPQKSLTDFPFDLNFSSKSSEILKYLKSTITFSYKSMSCFVANLEITGQFSSRTNWKILFTTCKLLECNPLTEESQPLMHYPRTQYAGDSDIGTRWY